MFSNLKEDNSSLSSVRRALCDLENLMEYLPDRILCHSLLSLIFDISNFPDQINKKLYKLEQKKFKNECFCRKTPRPVG